MNYRSPHPLYLIPADFPGVQAMFQDTQEHLTYSDEGGNLYVYATNLAETNFPQDPRALEQGYTSLADFTPYYTPTPEEVMRALQGPPGPAGPMGPKGDPGGHPETQAPKSPYLNPHPNWPDHRL